MKHFRWKPAAALLVCALPLVAQAQTDASAYCAYVTEQAKAQSDLLRTPAGVAGLAQQETGLPAQVVAGATLSLSNVRKAGLTLDAARKNCDLYRASTEMQQRLQYAVPALEKEALEHRLVLIDQASASLNTLIAETGKMVAAQNMTRPMLWSLQTNTIKLDADRADTEAKIAALYVPPGLSNTPLKAELAAKEFGDVSEQRAQAKLAEQSNWDVALTVGAHQQIDPVEANVGPYGQITASYNFASRAIDRHLDRSVEAYAQWDKVKEGDAERGAEELRLQLQAAVQAQTDRLASLQQQTEEVTKNLQVVADADTSAALDYRNQLQSSNILLSIEVGDATFRLARLKEFIAVNF